MHFINRVFGIIKIDNNIFKEIDKDGSAILQAFLVALLTAIVNALIAKKYYFSTANFDIPIVILIVFWIFLNWYVLSYLINIIGLNIFSNGKSKSKSKNLLRLIGYSYSPELIKFLIIFYPQFIQVISLGTFIWVVACQVLAVKLTFNLKGLWKSLAIIVLSYILQILLVAFLLLAILSFST